MLKLFTPISINDHQFLLASHMPKGFFWEKSFDQEDDLGKLLLGLASEFLRFQELEAKLSTEINIKNTDELLEDWEKSVGIPNSCFDTNISTPERRSRVLQVFSKFGGVQTADDFIRVADFFGFDVIIKTGKKFGTFALAFPIIFSSSTKAATHTIFIELNQFLTESNQFALLFPLNFSIGGKDFLQCIFDKLAPANVKVIVVNKGDI
jgi:uncharacterized protein YmfQ (DUF2313 family)